MREIRIKGGSKLNGEWKVQGSKNGVLPILAASLLCKGTTVIRNCPDIKDVQSMLDLMNALGVKTSFQDGELVVDAKEISGVAVEGEMASSLRASILLMGALIGRTKQCRIVYPGGCSIGKRPIDFHLAAMRSLGAVVEDTEGYINCEANQLRGNKIRFPFPSVGATENAILAAVLAEGTTILENVALEPEIMELCFFLNAAGAKIEGCGTKILTIQGVAQLHESVFEASADRIVAGTYLCAAAGCGGDITLRIGGRCRLDGILPVLSAMGGRIKQHSDTIRLVSNGVIRPLSQIWTKPYPGFPTDMQSQVMVVLTKADGVSRIYETVFESRFQVAEELVRMGAAIRIEEQEAIIQGKTELLGTRVKASDLRGGAALVIAGLIANGETTIIDDTYIKRGYEDIVRDLTALRASIVYG